MVVLYFGDIFGRVGRKAIGKALPDLRAQYQPDIILCNAENLAGGRGVNRKVFAEMVGLGIHGFTSGNHIWDNREVYSILETDERLLRPANFPSPSPDLPCPGKGATVIRANGKALYVINVMGRVFMDAIDCPFQAVNKAIKEAPPDIPIFVDMHCDATSEKYAMAWHCAGRVAAVVGSHSHVQTADERILPGGTAYITDVGMSGAFDSVIGLEPAEIIKKFMTKRHQQLQSAKGNPGVGCVLITINPLNKATAIERLRFSVPLDGMDLTEGND